MPNFRIPDEVVVSPNLQFVRHLMNTKGTQWDEEKIEAIFPNSLNSQILQTPILAAGQERLVWFLSTSGKYLTMSAYQLLNKMGGCTPTEAEKRQWKNVWKSKLHTN